MKVTVIAIADELASAAELVMKKSAGIPVAIIRGVDYESRDASGGELIRAHELDCCDDESLDRIAAPVVSQ